MVFLCAALRMSAAVPQPTYVPQPPLHVQGNQLVDSTGQAFVLRGTAMPFRQASDAAVLTASVFSQIGQRWNMNALRLQISVDMDAADPTGYIAQVKQIVHDANAMQLVAILAPHDENDIDGAPTARMVAFWQKWAAAFRDEPMTMFDLYSQPRGTMIPGHAAGVHSRRDWAFWVHGGTMTDGSASPGMQALADAVRGTGARQVIVAMTLDENPLLAGFDRSDMLSDGNTVYEVCPLHMDNPTDADRESHYGAAAARMAVLANDWDLQLGTNNAECQSIPTQPGAAEALVKADLEFFDSHAISWTSSFFVPGKMIQDNVNFFPTRLNASWTCGQPSTPEPGMGETVRYHLWGAADDAAITVNGAAGGLAIAPGSVAVVYGQPVLTTATGLNAGTTVTLTDATGKTWAVPLLYVAPSSINFVVPADLSPGLVGVSVENAGGPNLTGSLVALPVAPGLFSATGDGRGAVVAFNAQTGDPTFTCDGLSCTTLPVAAGALVQLIGTGLRGVQGAGQISVTVGGIAARVVSAGVFDEALGTDQVVIEIGPELSGMGEVDLILRAAGQLANCVRIRV
jgi:uncharacterized protein (TIGR03437 family)